MQAGFSKINITPPLGTPMMGVGNRDLAHGCTGIHDDIWVRGLWVEHEGEAALIISFDLCFIGREDSDRFKGALGRVLDLAPRQILLSATHSHVSPAIGSWYAAGYAMPDRLYLQALQDATLRAAETAKKTAREATMWAGMGRSSLPLNRRLQVDGKAQNAPNPGGPVCEALPVCLLKDLNQKPICCLFSVATHPSILRGWEISSEFCGRACELIDESLGCEAALFLQGTAGDSKPRTIANGGQWNWDADWADAEATARVLVDETQAVIDGGLQYCDPRVRSALIEMQWPLATAPTREDFESVIDNAEEEEQVKCAWATRQIERIKKYDGLPTHAPVLLQAMQLGTHLQLIAIEGEPMAYHGNAILKTFDGVTFPLGYANGEALYLVTSEMPEQGGMEPGSYWEYGFPSPLLPGSEAIFEGALLEVKQAI